jgi:hypothetical protein
VGFLKKVGLERGNTRQGNAVDGCHDLMPGCRGASLG